MFFLHKICYFTALSSISAVSIGGEHVYSHRATDSQAHSGMLFLRTYTVSFLSSFLPTCFSCKLLTHTSMEALIEQQQPYISYLISFCYLITCAAICMFLKTVFFVIDYLSFYSQIGDKMYAKFIFLMKSQH